MPKPRRRNVFTRHDRSDFVTGGGIIQMVAGLPEPVQDWLIDSIPEGATLTDLLRAIVIDAYDEEHHDETETRTDPRLAD